jgi:hypothetical protein
MAKGQEAAAIDPLSWRGVLTLSDCGDVTMVALGHQGKA